VVIFSFVYLLLLYIYVTAYPVFFYTRLVLSLHDAQNKEDTKKQIWYSKKNPSDHTHMRGPTFNVIVF